MALKINRTVTTITRIVGWGLTIALFVCFAKVYIWEQNYYKEQTISARAKSQSVITKLPKMIGLKNSLVSSEEYAKFQVEAKAPRYIRIERTKLSTIVRGKSIANDGSFMLSDNINEAAWYSGSSNPGDSGAIVIAGVSSYNDNSGALRSLDTLEKGDKVEIESGDGNVYTYLVESINITSNKDAEKILPTSQQRREGKETLSLISVSDGSESFILIRATKQ